MSRRIQGLALSAILCGAAQSAAAADALSSSYWEAAYLNSRVDDGTTRDTPEGFRVAASVGLASFLNFTGDFDQRRSGGERLGFGSAGFAFHTRNPVYRFHLGATYERIVSDAAEPEEGYGVEAGVAYALPNVALQAAYRHLDFGETAAGADLGGSRYGATVALQLSNWWSLVAGYSVREHELDGPGATTTEYGEWTVGLRRHFVTATDRRARNGGVLSGAAE